MLGEEHQLAMLSEPYAIPAVVPNPLGKSEPPFLVWMSSKVCSELSRLPEQLRLNIHSAPKVVLLDEGYSLADFESACDLGITEILRPPLARERVADVVRRALEATAVHHDMECMAREIALERELLERKNEILSFLVNFLTQSTTSLELADMLQTAYQGLDKLLPLRSLHAVLWEKNDNESPALSLFISAPESGPANAAWRDALFDQARRVIGPNFTVADVQRLHIGGQPEDWAAQSPEDGAVLVLPLICDTEQLGVLMLLTSMERHLGRDQAMALDSAMRHFSLTVKNARRFRVMQMYADYDALTRVHSRRHFESRIEEEMQRFTRYGEPLSLIMLDIDRFKSVNDTRGHHVGDIVLREVAGLAAESIRSMDYCARYGGEEFVILLPHTSHKKALLLAERIRKKIAGHTFLIEDGASLTITASLGVASLTKGTSKSKQDLVCEADAALYLAKSNGRNRTCGHSAIALSQQPSRLAACQTNL